ncbi:unnamed protein product [Tilletia caries]|uniref:SnoaL-like domain-containing protein n=1 Tax=Tilletia controversa TaxID=13291 RepID=A0A8X7SZ94_9BASI|nr:hypothetical protein CF336_g6131 [Tilletia laevis]KAE8188838.1 hypothetical protein CF328_g6474 [Tilletia controversa]KAE8253022.1 hypothetical protein A4X06_0g1752 [Tilletia controversa]CAD6884453.1 unnamed protein product [Tilletia caries]CAD7061720.1 unnamed protein product [Tilletia caries]
MHFTPPALLLTTLIFISSYTIMASTIGATTFSALSPRTATLIQEAQALFQAKFDPAIFARHWAPNPVFVDPIAYASGMREVMAQWKGMTVFSESKTLDWKLTKDEPNRIEWEQRQFYKTALFSKTMESTVVLELDDEGRITHFEDRWNHKPISNGITYPLRRLNAIVMPFLTRPPPPSSL